MRRELHRRKVFDVEDRDADGGKDTAEDEEAGEGNVREAGGRDHPGALSLVMWDGESACALPLEML